VEIAELKIMDHQGHDCVIMLALKKGLEAACRKRLRNYLSEMANLRCEGKLLPLKFDEWFFTENCCFYMYLNQKMAPLGATKFSKVNDQQ